MKLTKRTGAVLVIAAALTIGCVTAGRYCPTWPGQVSNEENMEDSLPEEIAGSLNEEEGKDGSGQTSGRRENSVEAAKLTWKEVPVELTDSEFTFGAIHMALPEESTWDYEKREDGTVSVCLWALEKPASFKKMYFTHYRVSWKDTWELKLAALELTGLNKAEWFFFMKEEEEDKPRNRTFGIEMKDDKNRKNYYVLVYEEDLYFLEDNDAMSYKFRFGNKSEENNLTWDDAGGSIVRKDGYGFYCLDGRNRAFLEEERQCNGDKFVLLYREGDFEKPVQVFGVNVSILEDINFDGYFDILVSDRENEKREYLLWCEEEGRFVEAVTPQDAEFSFCMGKDMVEEFKTIWEYDDEWNVDTGERSRTTEKLYRWEGTVLKEMRSISGEIRGEDVLVELTDRENGECLTSGSFPRENWQENPEIQKLYRKFYEGYAPQEFYYTCHTASGKEKYIPDSLTEPLAKALQDGKEDEFLLRLKGGRKLSDKEMEEAGLQCAGIADVLWNRAHYDGMLVEMVRADFDGDGVEDIYAGICKRGSGGFTDYIVYRGIEDGGYQETGHGSGIYWNAFTVIRFEGKNYICRKSQDYNKKIMDGLVLEGYRDGKMAETVTLHLVQGETEVSVRSCRKGYQEMAQKEREKAEDIFEKTEKFRAVIGEAEQKVPEKDNTYRGDIDNDGEIENYIKGVWTPSNMVMKSSLDFYMEEETALEKAIYGNREKRGVPLIFWVDEWKDKNIANVMYRTDLYDYMIEGYLLNDAGDYKRLYLIEKKSERAVEIVRQGQNTMQREMP